MAMATNLTPSEEAQLATTIEMFEIIVQSDANYHQSLEILKEAYSKLGRTNDVVNTSKRMAKAYEGLGQLSSAILEYESILELRPDDPDVKAALAAIENRASSFGERSGTPDTDLATKTRTEPAKADAAPSAKAAADGDDGRTWMRKVFVDGKLVSAADFEQYWKACAPQPKPAQVCEPFIQVLADKQVVPLEQSLKLICEKSRICYLPLEKYDVDVEMARKFSREACFRWCVLPFDRMSKSILVATTNPWNQQAAAELKGPNQERVLWYLTSPQDLQKVMKKVFR